MGESTGAFYDGLAADCHLLYPDWDAAIARHGVVLDQVIRAAPGLHAQDVLDCACGIGTQALGLAARGYRVTGSDLSQAAIARAEGEAARRGIGGMAFVVADMREVDRRVAGRFDVVLAADNALPHLLTPDDLAAALGAIAAKLRPGGLLVASIRDYDRLLAERPDGVPPRFLGEPGRRRIVHQIWEWLDQRRYRVHLYLTCEQERGWRVDHHVGVYRALLRAELAAALAAAGLVDVRWRMPEASGYFQPLVTARKPPVPEHLATPAALL